MFANRFMFSILFIATMAIVWINNKKRGAFVVRKAGNCVHSRFLSILYWSYEIAVTWKLLFLLLVIQHN